MWVGAGGGGVAAIRCVSESLVDYGPEAGVIATSL
jgi:hypothetical protein